MKNLTNILLSLFLVSCTSVSLNDTNTNNNKFKSKSIDNNDQGIVYKGDWFYNDINKEKRRYENYSSPTGVLTFDGTAYDSNYQTNPNQNRAKITDMSIKGSFTSQNYVVEENDTIYPITTTPNKWVSTIANGISKASSEKFILNDGLPYPIAESLNNNSSIDDFNSSYFLGFNDFNINGYNYKYSQNYSSLPNTNYSSTQSWKSKNNFKYTYDRNAYAEVIFSGTNIGIMTRKGKDPGWNNLKAEIYTKNESGNYSILEKTVDNIDMYSPTEIDYELKFSNLTNKDHKIILKSASTSRSEGKNSFLIAIGYATVYPCFQYEFTGKNISYKAFKYNSAGMVNVTVDDLPTKTISLYAPVNKSSALNSEIVTAFRLYSDYYTDYNGQQKPHTITIEAINEKGKDSNGNIVSTGTEINIDQLCQLPSVSGNLLGESFYLLFAKGPDYGKVDLYIDDKYYLTIDLYKNNTYESGIPDFESNGVISSNYLDFNKFTIVPALEENIITNKYKVGFDGYSRTMPYAEYNFTSLEEGKLYYYGTLGTDRGEAGLSLYNGSYWSNKITNLYGPESVQRLVTVGTNTEFNISSNTNYNLTIRPNFTKSPSSTSYSINIASLQFKNNSSEQGDMDLICTP